jgi:hypothetical protein
MIVVPTEEEVVLEFSNTWAETGGLILTAVTLVGLVAWGVVARVRRKRAEARAEA